MSDFIVRVQTQDFDPNAEYQWLRADSAGSGALLSFVGQVREFNLDSDVSALQLEHYPGMTEKVLEKLLTEARQRWQLSRAKIIHRYGRLAINDQIVYIGVASPHRDEAFDACRFLIDVLKTQAPFWKKEIADSGERWLDARASDQEQAKKWIT
ncbi:MAG: molybdopterin synthase catalytic subunit MoaE [Cellvibrionaceae bacterium]|nr:molybdopterin synthase catalytic subunit MoaE [Cellvibrionaceae bacterium]MCV6627004.1 molybdopterin synthase catalytic subunit MoaE [Cellvibrionaceae bacterium]